MILADVPGVVHIGMWAPLDVRVQTAMEREHFGRQEAEKYVGELEEARVTFFRKFFKVNPYDPSLYHITLNMGMIQPGAAAEVITHTVDQLGH